MTGLMCREVRGPQMGGFINIERQVSLAHKKKVAFISFSIVSF
ncbi:hypothetical protein WP3S18E02_13990 [Aeromonas caviae]|jgi:hypothetical protein|nr:hypothetical protein WP3S18E02_13990 [Aeromonas caviae]